MAAFITHPTHTAHPDMPEWCYPVPKNKSNAAITPERGAVLKVMNSLTRTKTLFQTASGSNTVRWYMCGPTVYDASHMGHARTYLGFDIIRRILTGYFNYDVTLCMNITDIDDKIIKRSNEAGVPFDSLSRHWESEFLKDMDDLNVSRPDVMTRVSEYMPEISVYIQSLIDKGYAYESEGSVYFDVGNFNGGEEGHCYCKLMPTAIGNAKLLAEGEGSLTQDFGNQKKSSNDFALWKKVKEGEPSWDSPFGPGRPGWHIECSVMASDVFRSLGEATGGMDIHSGGVDLKFPHHDNEMAQAEAESGSKQWVNYFIHSGHLHIKGFKMSKSLKNFITIQQALKQNTARQIRLCFLMHKYNEPMDYGDETMAHAVEREKSFANFFGNVKAVLREASKDDSAKWTSSEATLGKALENAKSEVYKSLCDDFDTPSVLKSLQTLVDAVNIYLLSVQSSNSKPVELIVRSAGSYITRIFKVFGLVPEGVEIGFPVGGGGGEDAGEDKEEVLSPFLDAILNFRSSIRDAARSKDFGALLTLCDNLRDSTLPSLGVQLEDKGGEGGRGVWKLQDPEEVKKRKEIEEMERRRKEEDKLKREREAEEKAKAAMITPEEFIKALKLDDGTPQYSNFGPDGLPTHTGSGEELNKSAAKKAKKIFETQKKKYEKAMKKK